jgi:hypothetical protein
MKSVKHRFARTDTTPPAATPAPAAPPHATPLPPDRVAPCQCGRTRAAPTSRRARAGPRRSRAPTTRLTMPSFVNRRPVRAATQLPRLCVPSPLRPRHRQPQQRPSSEVRSSTSPPPQSRPSWRPKACKSAYLHVGRHLYCLVTTRAATPVTTPVLPCQDACSVFWLAVLYIVIRLILADNKAVLLAYYASLRLFSCSFFTYILRSAVAQRNLLARRSRPLMSGLPRRRRGRG